MSPRTWYSRGICSNANNMYTGGMLQCDVNVNMVRNRVSLTHPAVGVVCYDRLSFSQSYLPGTGDNMFFSYVVFETSSIKLWSGREEILFRSQGPGATLSSHEL